MVLNNHIVLPGGALAKNGQDECAEAAWKVILILSHG